MDILSFIKERDISVYDGYDAKNFMKKTLFGKMWIDATSKFHKLIFVVVPSELADDAIRKINNVIGTLPDRKGVMLIMQKIDYISGYLKD